MPRIAEVRTGSDKKKQYLNVNTLYRTLRIFRFFMPTWKVKTTVKGVSVIIKMRKSPVLKEKQVFWISFLLGMVSFCERTG